MLLPYQHGNEKIRVLAVWLTAAIFGRAIASLEESQHQRAVFVSGGEALRDYMHAK